jgi:hypothetical protein
MGNTSDTSGKSSDNPLPNFLSGSKEKSCCPKMTLKQRAIGWLVCSVIGWLLSIMATISLLTSSDATTFAILYSIGQMLNIAGSVFLATPKGQWKAMTNKSRLVTSIVYVVSIILTLVIALATNIKPLVFLFLIIQVIAYYWYTISFIPFGQRLAKGIFKSCCC